MILFSNKFFEQISIYNLFSFFWPSSLIFSIFGILSSRVLRSSPCTHYFLAYAIFSIIYTCLACPTQFLRGYSIDWANERVGCKIHFYFLFVVPVQAKVMLLLASFDRYCSSSRSCQFSVESTIRTARISIVVGSIFTSVYMSPMLFIYHWNEESKTCTLRSNTLIYIYICSQIIFYYILTPLLMTVFGVFTILNIRHQSIRAKLMTPALRHRRNEGQLARMLLLQVGIHLILILPFGVTYTINAFDPSTRTQNILAIRYILVLWQQCDYFVSFFLYVLSGSVYRKEFFRIYRSTLCRGESYPIRPHSVLI